MDLCKFILHWNGELCSFDNEWALDSFLYSNFKEWNDSKSTILFSADAQKVAAEKLENIHKEMSKYAVEHTVVSSEDGEEILETYYKIPNSTGVSTFIKSSIAQDAATTSFDKEGLFSIMGVTDTTIKNSFESDWNKIRQYGTDFHKVLELIGKHDDKAKKEALKLADGNEELAQKIVKMATDLFNEIVENHGSDAQLFFEFPIISLPNEQGGTVNGRLDLLVLDSKGKITIYDFKVSPKKPGNWASRTNSLIGSDLYSSAKKRDIDRQMAAYHAILRQRGFMISGTRIIAITPETFYSGDNAVEYQIDDRTKQAKYGIKSFGEPSYEIVSPLSGEHLGSMQEVFPVVESKTINLAELDNQMRALFPNYDPKITSKNVDPERLAKRGSFKHVVSENDPEYNKGARYRFKDLTTNTWVYAVDNEEFLEKTKEYVERFNRTRHVDKLSLASAIEDVLDANNKTATFETFLDSEAYTDIEKSKLKQLFKPYIQDDEHSEWTLLNEPQYIDNGIFIFINQSAGIVDFVSLSETAITDQAPMSHKSDWQNNYTSLIGAFTADYDIEDKFMLQGTYGNVELCRLMLLANSGIIDLSQYRLNSFKTCNPRHQMQGSIIELSAQTLYNNFTKLVKTANYVNNGENNGAPQVSLEISEDNILPMIDYVAYRIGQLKSKLSLEQGTYDINDTVSCYNWCIGQLDTLKRSSESVRKFLAGTNKNMDDPEIEVFALLNSLLLTITRQEIPYEKDKAPIINFRGGMEIGLEIASPQLSPSKKMRMLGEITAMAYNKITSEYTKYYMSKCLSTLKKYRKFQNANPLLGNEFALTKNLFRTEADGVTLNPNLLLKDPSDPSLSAEEKAVLKMFFETLDEFRFKNQAQKDSALADGSYYWCPLLKANKNELIVNGSLKLAKDVYLEEKSKLIDLFKEQEESQGTSYQNYRIYDPFAIDLETRQTMLTNHDISEFSLDIDRILRSYLKTKIKVREFNRIMPEVIAVEVMVQYHEHLSGELTPNILKTVHDYVKLNLFDKPIMDETLEAPYRMASVIRDLSSVMMLGFNYRSGIRELMQGMWTHISRTMVEMYGRDQFDAGDIAKAWGIIFKLGLHNPNFIGMFEQINAEYQMANAGVSEIENLIAGVKTGVLNFDSDILYICNKIPDYFHRMGIFIAKMLHDGSWYAHTLNEDGVLVYDFDSDERFNLLNKPGVDKNSSEYKKQLGTYIALRQQFLKEGFSIPPIKENEPIAKLPRAYTFQEGQSIKTFADMCFGHYDKETQMMLKHRFLGAFMLQFKTYYSAKLEQWIMGRGNYCIGSYKHLEDVSGEKLMLKIDYSEDGTLDSKVVKESELQDGDYAVPHKEWTSKYLEGILYTVYDAGKSLYKRDWDEFKSQMKNPTKKANMGIFVRDMIWANIMMAIIGLLLTDMKESDAPLAAYTLVSAWKNSYADGPITNLIKGMVGDFNPPMYSSTKKLYRNFKNLLTGDSGLWEFSYKTFGALRDFGTYK